MYYYDLFLIINYQPTWEAIICCMAGYFQQEISIQAIKSEVCLMEYLLSYICSNRLAVATPARKQVLQ